jgi:hypothetical protein
MSNKTIAKILGLVILFAPSAGFLSSCSHASPSGRYVVNSSELSPDYEKPVAIGRIESADVMESSGLASSLCQSNVLWTHNDSGDDAFIFAMDRKGKHLGTWRVANARNADWEDMASYKDSAGGCYLYIGDIGNNKGERAEQRVYRVKEPVVSIDGASSSKKNPLETEPGDALVFKYPDAPHDAETLMVQPQAGDIYVLTKRVDGPSGVYKIKPQFGSGSTIQAERVAELSLPAVPNGLLTGGAISPDGRRVVVCDYTAGYELNLGNAASFDEVWKQRPVPVDLGDRKQGEAVTFSEDGRSVLATSERKNSPLIEARRK